MMRKRIQFSMMMRTLNEKKIMRILNYKLRVSMNKRVKQSVKWFLKNTNFEKRNEKKMR